MNAVQSDFLFISNKKFHQEFIPGKSILGPQPIFSQPSLEYYS